MSAHGEISENDYFICISSAAFVGPSWVLGGGPANAAGKQGPQLWRHAGQGTEDKETS